MNLSEFLEYWDKNTSILVKCNGKIVFRGKVKSISDDVACRLWILEKGVYKNDEELCILAEDEEEVNRKLFERNKSIVCSKKNVRKRIEILEALKWAQEHQNQIYHLLCNATDPSDAKRQLKMLYRFNEEQVCAIIDMRVRIFCKKERDKVEEELQAYLERKSMSTDLD